MKPISKILFLGILTLGACNQHAEKPAAEKKHGLMDRISWLNGSWMMQDKEGIITEEWHRINDSLMEGRSDFLTGDTVIPFETIRIYNVRDTFFYEAKAAGQNNEQPVAFAITSSSDSGFVAENPLHDFPQKISYRLVNRDSIHAFVEGGEAMPKKRIDFNYSRKKITGNTPG